MRKRLGPRIFRWAVLAPSCIYGIALLVGVIWMPQLPNPIAAQWSGDSVASTQSLAAFYATLAMLLIATVIFLCVLAVKSRKAGDVRLSIAICNGAAVFAGGAMLLLASGQRGIEDARMAPSPSWIGMATLAVLGGVVGLGVWRVCDPSEPEGSSPTRLRE